MDSGGGNAAAPPILGADNGLMVSPFKEVQLGQNIGQVGSPANLLANREIPLNGNELHILPGVVFYPSGNTAIGPIGAYADDGFSLLQVHEAGGGNAFVTARTGTITNIFGTTPNGGLIGTQSNDDLEFFTHGTQRMVVTAAGYLQLTELGTPGLTNFDIRQRNAAINGPITVIQPSGNPGFPNANIAVDIMPKGSPGDFLTNGVAWLDVCNSDCQASSLIDTQTARVAVFTDRAVFGSASFGTTITPIPVAFVVNLGEVARFDIAGRFGIATAAPTAQLHVIGPTGYDQFNIQTQYTPTGTADPNGHVGDVCFDDLFGYRKTTVGWKRWPLTIF